MENLFKKKKESMEKNRIFSGLVWWALGIGMPQEQRLLDGEPYSPPEAGARWAWPILSDFLFLLLWSHG
jgi:hypothetical protein